MKRNMKQTVEKIKGKNIIPAHYDMDGEEMSELFNMIVSQDNDAIFNALSMAFDYGFVLGARAQEAGKLPHNI